jgi:hypothetical protein
MTWSSGAAGKERCSRRPDEAESADVTGSSRKRMIKKRTVSH